MSDFEGLSVKGPNQRVVVPLLILLLGLSLAACGGGSDDDGSTPPPSPPAPPAPPTPPAVPPVSSTVINLDGGQQIGATHWPDGATSVGGQGQPVGTLECNAATPGPVHIHAHLSIFLNGEQLAIPSRIGFVDSSPSSSCHYQLHSHDRTGLVHVHATTPTDFTLGQYFAIWGQPLETANIAGETGMPVKVYITDAGVVSEVTSNWSAIVLDSHREVTIQIGTAITEIPNYTWAGN